MWVWLNSLETVIITIGYGVFPVAFPGSARSCPVHIIPWLAVGADLSLVVIAADSATTKHEPSGSRGCNPKSV